MIRRKLLAAAITAATAAPATAGVQTMTSDEMVETYVEDSAVIVVPKDQQKSEADRQRIIQALTISPGEPVVTEAEEEAYQEALQRYLEDDRKDSLTDAEEEFLRRALLLPVDELARAQPPAEFRPDIPQLIFGQQPEIPDEPFTQTFLNDQLGIGFDGQNLNFSIGNPPGIDRINIPQGINEGPINLTPRPGGGFDLSIAVPEE
jgi:predicted house-cleaning noncanonical NTP pyrophosphatase (MazG superfamily)